MFHIDCTFRADRTFAINVLATSVYISELVSSFIIVRTILVSRYRAREISQKFGYNARDVLVEKNLW